MVQGDRVVNAQDGAILAGFTADVEFDVVDSAMRLQLRYHCLWDGAGGLDEATMLLSVAVVL